MFVESIFWGWGWLFLLEIIEDLIKALLSPNQLNSYKWNVYHYFVGELILTLLQAISEGGYSNDHFTTGKHKRVCTCYLQNSNSNHDCFPTISYLLGILKRQHVLSNIQLGCSDDESEMENEGKDQDIVVLWRRKFNWVNHHNWFSKFRRLSSLELENWKYLFVTKSISILSNKRPWIHC